MRDRNRTKQASVKDFIKEAAEQLLGAIEQLVAPPQPRLIPVRVRNRRYPHRR